MDYVSENSPLFLCCELLNRNNKIQKWGGFFFLNLWNIYVVLYACVWSLWINAVSVIAPVYVWRALNSIFLVFISRNYWDTFVVVAHTCHACMPLILLTIYVLHLCGMLARYWFHSLCMYSLHICGMLARYWFHSICMYSLHICGMPVCYWFYLYVLHICAKLHASDVTHCVCICCSYVLCLHATGFTHYVCIHCTYVPSYMLQISRTMHVFTAHVSCMYATTLTYYVCIHYTYVSRYILLISLLMCFENVCMLHATNFTPYVFWKRVHATCN